MPTPGHTKKHLSVVVDRGDHLVLTAGDACYSERPMVDGVVDGVAQDTRAHRDTTRRLRELCRRRSVITQFAHDPASPERLTNNTPTRFGGRSCAEHSRSLTPQSYACLTNTSFAVIRLWS